MWKDSQTAALTNWKDGSVISQDGWGKQKKKTDLECKMTEFVLNMLRQLQNSQLEKTIGTLVSGGELRRDSMLKIWISLHHSLIITSPSFRVLL